MAEVNQKFEELFTKVLDIVTSKYDVKHEDVDAAVKEIKKSWQQTNLYSYEKYGLIDYTVLVNRCGFFKRYGSHVAELVRHMILKSVPECPELSSVFSKSHLKVVSLGGGCGNDVIGFCSALKDVKDEKECSGTLEITIVDCLKEWFDEFVTELSQVLKEDDEDFGNCTHVFRKHLSSDISFLHVKLPCRAPNADMSLLLGKADIIIIVRMISVMKLNDDIWKTVENLYSMVNEDTVIVVIDSAFKKEDLLVDWFSGFNLLYNTPADEEYDFHDVNSRTVLWVFKKEKNI